MTTPTDAFMRQQHDELVVQAAQKAREERFSTIFFTALMACVLCCFAVLLFATLFLR
jgi:formate/nitrite transporter FocA (FNT family)